MEKLATLHTNTVDGCSVESFDFDYIVKVPTSYADKPCDMQRFCEKAFRNAALGTLLGAPCERILKSTCNDYNWGDFVQYHDKEILAQFGICELENYDGAYSKDMVSPRVIIDMNHDENLLPSNLDCSLIVCEEGKEPLRIVNCEIADFSSCRIDYPEEADYIQNISNASFFVDFGNGVKHRVARNEEEQEKNGIMFVLEQYAKSYSTDDEDFLAEKNDDIDNSVYDVLVAVSKNYDVQRYVQIAVNHLSNASYAAPAELTEEIILCAKKMLEMARWNDNGVLEWDMCIIGNLELFIEDQLEDVHVPICHPWYDENERICCSTNERCKYCNRA